VRRALARIGESLAREISSPPYAESWLGRVEARAKVVGVLTLVIVSTLLHELTPLAALFATTLILALSLGLPTRRLVHVWLGVPLLNLAIILPAATNLVTPGLPLMTIWRFGHPAAIGPWVIPEAIAVTNSGLIVAGRFLLRSADCITLSYLLVVTTDPQALLHALSRLGMPKMFGMVLTMAQRYLGLVLRAAKEIHLAKLSRTITGGPTRGEQRWVAAGIGTLFRRAHRLAQEVENAMLSRGFDGDLQLSREPSVRPTDFAWLVATFVLGAVLVISEHL
jgi:cobalt/nickel transport system permease protein